MTKAESVPDPVWAAGVGIVGGEVIQVAVSSLQAADLIAIGISAGAAMLLINGSGAGWILAMLWAASEVSAPLVMGSPIWVAMIGVAVALALVTTSAREYCLTGADDMDVSEEPPTIRKDMSASVPIVETASERRIWGDISKRLLAIRINKNYAFLGFLIGTVVLLPVTGLLGRAYRGSARGSSLVEVGYHVVVLASTLSQIGLIVTLVLMIRAALR